jgi:hypothetical protein
VFPYAALPEGRVYLSMWTLKADWAADTVVDTGMTRSSGLTGPGSRPIDESSDETF